MSLIELNSLRAAAGMKPLKAWKESKAKLAETIAKLQSKTNIMQQLEASIRAIPNVDQKSVKVRTIQKPVKVKEGISIGEIAFELKIDPKVARAKLRRRTDVPRVPGKQWVFAAKDVATVKTILSEDKRKKS